MCRPAVLRADRVKSNKQRPTVVKMLAPENKHLLAIKTVKYWERVMSWVFLQCLFHLCSHVLIARPQKADECTCNIVVLRPRWDGCEQLGVCEQKAAMIEVSCSNTAHLMLPVTEDQLPHEALLITVLQIVCGLFSATVRDPQSLDLPTDL